MATSTARNFELSDLGSPSSIEEARTYQNSSRRSESHLEDANEPHGEEFSLPQADGGREAWLFLVGAFTTEALVWGFPFSFGVFQNYYSQTPPFSSQPVGIAAIGTSATGFMYLGSPIAFYIMQRFPSMRRLSLPIGLVIIVVALVISSFSSAVWHLVVTQGFLYAMGGLIMYSPAILLLDEWFIQRKGLAYGMMWAGTGVSGLIVPIVMEWGLKKYGFRIMLRAWAVTLVVLSTPLMHFVKPRLPPPQASGTRRISFGFVLSPTFLFLEVGNIVQGLGYFIPSIYMPTFARSLGVDPTVGAFSVSLFNLASVFGQMFLGMMVDRVHVTTVTILATVIATLSVFLLWGFAINTGTLYGFALVYGLSAGGFTSTYSGIMKEVVSLNPRTDGGSVFGLLAAGRGIGSVISGPLSEALLGKMEWQRGYGALIIFTGVTAAGASVSWIGRQAKLLRKQD